MSRDINPTAASLLGFLHGGPMTGWEIDRAVAASISNFWNVTRSQVYRELRTLADLGYVEAGETGARERRPHRITPAGREAFARWIARDPGPANIRMPFLLSVFFSDLLPKERLREILDRERKIAEEQLERYAAMYEACPEGGPRSVLRFAVGYEMFALAWLDSLLPPEPGAEPQERPDGA